MITRKDLIQKYLKFFEGKGHKIIPSSSLIPTNDPSVLFTTAGMHPLVPYLLGQKHPFGKRLAGIQKCVRTTDIDLVGDENHHTFFEMLGNWSLGDYWKKEAIEYSFEFLTRVLDISKEKISVTCFKGDKDAPKDTESENVWKFLKINKIKFLGKEENWWGPAGTTGPCGPDTEMFVNGLEIWNDVFMEYNKTKEKKFLPLQQKNVDTGMGVERTLAILNGLDDNYLTEVWRPLIDEIEHLSSRQYNKNKKVMRIIADHVKAAVFIISDGVLPSNTGAGYVLRRLIRRAIRFGKILGINSQFTHVLVDSIIKIYQDYEDLKKNKKFVIQQLKEEEVRFDKTINNGLKKLEEFSNRKIISGKEAFLLYQSYGFPLELTTEIAKEKKIKIDVNGFNEELKKHQELSKTASAEIFKSGLANSSQKTIKLHTATHLLNESLRRILGKDIKQKGSNITSERLRFDFNFSRKLSEEEIKKVENLVNEKISNGLDVVREEMSLEEALKSGAQSEFGTKYPEKVSVYTILEPKNKNGWFSKEICTGPHAKNTHEIGKFKIIKEESVATGIRRIKAVVE